MNCFNEIVSGIAGVKKRADQAQDISVLHDREMGGFSKAKKWPLLEMIFQT